MLLLILGSLLLRVDKETCLVHHLDELSLSEHKEGVAKLRALNSEDCLEQMLVLQKGNVCFLAVDEVEERILLLALFDVNVRILEHGVECVLVGLVG